MEQEAPDELVGAERHGAVPHLPVAAVILVAEGYTTLVESNEPAVGDGDAVSVAGEIGEHCCRPREGAPGRDEPLLPFKRCQKSVESLATTQAFDLAKEREPAGRVGIDKRCQEKPPEQSGKHPHRQEKAGLAAHPARPIERYPAARHNHMDVRMARYGAPR